VRPGKCHRTTKEWRQRHADAGGRFDEQLGLHSDDLAGLEPESLVWTAHAQSRTRPGADGDGCGASRPFKNSDCRYSRSPKCTIHARTAYALRPVTPFRALIRCFEA